MVQYNHVFSPFKIGNIEIKNRIETAPILPCSATPEGFMTREMIEFYRSFAKGGAAIITIGDTPVDFEYARGHFGQLNLGDDRVVAGLSTMAEAIHAYGAKISIELNHAGRLASPRVIHGKNPIAPSPIPPKTEEAAAILEGRQKTQVREMNQDMIDKVIDNFASACYRSMLAGFDMVMLHGGHGWLLGQFVSPYSNKRTDAYGGSLENRAKFILELLTAIRRRVGNGLALEYRISVDEEIPEGMHEKETIEFLKLIEDKVDLIHASVGVIGDPRCTTRVIQPTYSPYAFNVHRAEKIKKALRTPVTCVGSIMDLATADKIIAEGKADIVAIGRAYLSDPEIITKTIRGDLDDIRPCIRCNMCHERVAPPVSLPIRCAVNPVIGREVEYRYIRMAEKKKTVLIAGGGPAGMESALVASSRGHRVVLYEKEKGLGGALRFAAGPAFKADMKKYLDWMIMKTQQAPVDVKLSTEATVESINAVKPDALIVAVGAEPIIPDIPGVDKPHVAWAGNVVLGRAKTGETVVIAGAGLTGCETALHLAQQGKKVTVIDMISEREIAQDVASISKPVLLQLLREHGVEWRTEVKLEAITDKGAVVIDKQWNQFELPADTVVLSMGLTARRETVNAFRGMAPEVYVVGDCSHPRNLMAAIHDAFNVAVEI
jgi:2,4-dienoyl-CoA reductase-like NADH-dependent reductase (Old Yellow Enzyme family)/NADPH-dependent 2,4-dienoyl-CoA reductase/sulfur reductase-like enzyme